MPYSLASFSLVLAIVAGPPPLAIGVHAAGPAAPGQLAPPASPPPSAPHGEPQPPVPPPRSVERRGGPDA
ncbi:MAG: hypothetical protein AB1Z98_35340, partial [Nannocystaceae bacterium]